MSVQIDSPIPPLRFTRVRSPAEASVSSIKVTLFRATDRHIRAWYIGPLSWSRSGGVAMPHLSPNDATLASIAVLRAAEAAREAKTTVCIVDPDNLWSSAWES